MQTKRGSDIEAVEDASLANKLEVCAVTTAVAFAPARLFVLTDSRCVERRARALLGGADISGKDSDHWTVLRRRIHEVAAVSWVKAHLTEVGRAEYSAGP